MGKKLIFVSGSFPAFSFWGGGGGGGETMETMFPKSQRIIFGDAEQLNILKRNKSFSHE